MAVGRLEERIDHLGHELTLNAPGLGPVEVARTREGLLDGRVPGHCTDWSDKVGRPSLRISGATPKMKSCV